MMKVRSFTVWLVGAAFMAAISTTMMATQSAQADISHGYPSDSSITPGSIVALKDDGSGKVVPAGQNLINRAIGVVVTGSTISLSGAGEVQVATDGVASTLVSTAAGDIKKGDYITISPIQAVGMKALASGRIIGVAQADFSAATAGSEAVNITVGKTQKTVVIGEIPIAVGVTTYNPKSGAFSVNGVIERIAASIAGKPVGTARLYIAMVIMLAGLVSSCVLLYAGVRTSIIAIGRNPLAKSSVTTNLLKIMGMVVIILSASSGAVWLVVR